MHFSTLGTVRSCGLPLSVLETRSATLYRGTGFTLHGSSTCEKLEGTPRSIQATPVGAYVWGVCECGEDVWGVEVERYFSAAAVVASAVSEAYLLRAEKKNGGAVKDRAAAALQRLSAEMDQIPHQLNPCAERAMACLMKLSQKKK